MKSWLQDNDIGVYSTHNKEKSVVVETFITMLKNKFINTGLPHQKTCVLIN